MGEIWDELLATQREREFLKTAMNGYKQLCVTEHKKRSPLECEECWPRLINRIRDRYLNSSSKEWFSGRRQFLQELDTMFAEARERKRNIIDISTRIDAEKEEWCREKLRNLGLTLATDQPDAVNRVLNDKSKPVEQLVSELKAIWSRDAGETEQAFKDFTAKLEAAGSPEAKREVYVEVFFQPNNDPQGAARCKKYIDMVRGGTCISDVVALMVRERQSQVGKKEERQRHLRRKDELTRAKAANEAAKAKKAKAKQDKIRAAQAAAQEHDLPPCTNCKKRLDDQNLQYCDFCVTLSEVYGFQDRSPTYFCSDACWQEGIEPHIKEAGHVCSGDGFRGGSTTEKPGYCKECILDHKVESFFCCLECFDEHFQEHREKVHMPKRDNIGEIYEDEDDLVHTSNDQYRARKIEDHWIPIEDAVQQWAKKLGATYTTIDD
ncbi:hypothetical protein BKA67DRAFT_537669 [Truncatella angustata]|uniref:Uncharacterized protein n=1 Tax=Truncatella angustata TaxID=152316 RepID=A0A9P8UGP8_9PEZI|nr:uncharacterized protein BKA67DRAFT_537669 [Truncatella angustata]KAH6651816.1 hypothetical protein BKA67DRAFT_537669 [Truncatella angustata]KAH8196010.1 hypothetical protein TruAng_009817 [Truncatella angustata]